MNNSLQIDGYAIHRSAFTFEEVQMFRREFDGVTSAEGSVCVRNVWEKSALFRELAFDPGILNLIPAGLSPVRCILFDKTPAKNWPVAWHQDLTIAVAEKRDVSGYGPWSVKEGVVHVQPPLALLENMVTVRINLDVADSDNGALRVMAGSHQLGKIPAHEVRNHTHEPAALTCECFPGDILVMSPLLLHSSRRSLTPSRRRVIHFEYARIEDLHPRLGWYGVPGAGGSENLHFSGIFHW